MSLKSGTQLGTYEILSPIGAGGMGEVYRARYTKLGREVAIKILPGAFRKRSASAGSLNHPNIAVIHGFEESDGRQGRCEAGVLVIADRHYRSASRWSRFCPPPQGKSAPGFDVRAA